MPLLDLGGEHEVEIDGDQYTLRKAVSWVQREKCKSSPVVYIKKKNLDNLRDIPEDELMPMQFDSDVDLQLLRLETYLVRWSHLNSNGNPVKINRGSLDRLPKSHVTRLLSEIRDLEKEQDGPADDSPLPEN